MDETLDGKSLDDFKHWKCDLNEKHILGVIERVRTRVQLHDETYVEYFTKRLIIFQRAVDLNAEVPAEIDVAGTLDGRMLSMVWKCSVPGCKCVKEWHPDDDAQDWLKKRYGMKTQKAGA